MRAEDKRQFVISAADAEAAGQADAAGKLIGRPKRDKDP